jgi:D-serine deaminase-like pyridoxal phosphate-dependent protein
VEYDGGFGRCGVQTPQEAADLARIIAHSSGLHFGGLMTYPSNEQAVIFAQETRKLLEPDGIPVECVSGGSTLNMWRAHTYSGINEHRAGMYVYGDRNMVKGGVMDFDQCAFRVITTVVSRPTSDRGILDGGSKTFSSDLFAVEGYGYLLEYPEANYYGISEEHGHIDFSNCAKKPEIGERVTVIPNHCCTANNLFREIVGVRNGSVEVVWPVVAHGMLQ